ncbi:hypothetical protein Droror1_Dr00005563 [Drosera rotundifolia]
MDFCQDITDFWKDIALSFPPLTLNNYNRWSIMMKTCLGGQGVWDVIEVGYDVMLEAAVTVKAKKETRMRDQEALYFLRCAIDDANLDKIAEAENAKTAWELLKKVYQNADERRKEEEEKKCINRDAEETVQKVVTSKKQKVKKDGVVVGKKLEKVAAPVKVQDSSSSDDPDDEPVSKTTTALNCCLNEIIKKSGDDKQQEFQPLNEKDKVRDGTKEGNSKSCSTDVTCTMSAEESLDAGREGKKKKKRKKRVLSELAPKNNDGDVANVPEKDMPTRGGDLTFESLENREDELVAQDGRGEGDANHGTSHQKLESEHAVENWFRTTDADPQKRDKTEKGKVAAKSVSVSTVKKKVETSSDSDSDESDEEQMEVDKKETDGVAKVS